MAKIHLILEGGGMRGAYTAGVLDYFLDHELYFNDVIGVSAGAGNASGYVSRANRWTITNLSQYSNDKRYISYRNLIKEGSIFGMDFIFKEIPQKILPLDFDVLRNSDIKFEVVTTNCVTGEPNYFQVKDLEKDIDYVVASSSLPVVSPMVHIDGLELLDGGIADPIPINYSVEQGYKLHLVVLTRNRGYRKSKNRLSKLSRVQYYHYPNLLKLFEERHITYNNSLDKVFELEELGSAVVIAPTGPINIGRMERNPERLLELYEMGYDDAQEKHDEILKLIEKSKNMEV